MEDHEVGREAFPDEESYRQHALRHSAAHVMAEAIGKLFPGARFAFGPPTADGFFYDVDVSRPITEADLTAIEAEMKAISKRNSEFRRRVLTREEARVAFADQPFKLYRIENIEGDISTFDQGGFVDLCAGPHVPRTGNVKHFKLLKVSGAYWLGDQANQQLQRVYGTVWPTREALDLFIFRQEEAKKRDHRKLGAQMGLFLFHDLAPGAPFWLEKGERLWHTLSEAMRAVLLNEGYIAVRTPMIFDKALFEQSGHWEHYRAHMFHFHKHEEGEEEGRVFGLKPMNCPSHMLIFGSTRRSYRELPLRIHDQGVLHRDEARGALGGLTRVRQFSQDDGHLFCTEEQVGDEVDRLLQLVERVYAPLGLTYKAKLSTRPAARLGEDNALWDAAEAALEAALRKNDLEFSINAGDGAFYGPKIDIDIFDALGRAWQCATIQVDYQTPRRFKLSYVGPDNTEHTPVVIHRAIFGSFERFVGILIEHYAGHFPMWLAPEQVRVLTVSEKSESWGRAVHAALLAAGVRSEIDAGAEKIGAKIRDAHTARPVYMVVVGEKEQDTGTVAVRGREGDLGTMPLDAFVTRCVAESKVPF